MENFFLEAHNVVKRYAHHLALDEVSIQVPRGQIFLEDKSASTRENLRFSRKYADAERDKVGIVTNDFHIYRSSLIARQEGYRNIYLIPADSNPVFQLNYLVREFFGVIQVCLFH